MGLFTSLLAMAVAGCGGGGGNHSSDSGNATGASKATLVPSADYNGSTAPLGGSSTSVAFSGQLYSSIGGGGRTLTFTFPRLNFATGDTFIAGAAGAAVDYTDTGARDGTAPRWSGQGGTIKVVSVGSSGVRFEFGGIAFSPAQTDGTVQAKGTFTLAGKLEGIPNGEPTTTNTTSIVYSEVNAPEIDTGVFPTNADISVIHDEGQYKISTIERKNELPSRQFSFHLPDGTEVGTTLPLTMTGDNGSARGYFFQLSPSEDYRTDSGSVTLVSKTASTVELRFSNVHFRSTTSNASVGFVVNGSLKKG